MTVAGVASLIAVAVIAGAQESPYASETGREIKALSAEEVQGYLEGRGMGFAIAGELNGYPGPKHVLELDQELGLAIDQRAEIEAIFDDMQRNAVQLGRTIVERERQLDSWFAQGEIDESRLATLTEEIGQLNGRLRGVHLRAHLEAAQVLSRHQRMRYGVLRGYGEGEHRGH
jgi:Spy/CpxP family protein refolding chaperone